MEVTAILPVPAGYRSDVLRATVAGETPLVRIVETLAQSAVVVVATAASLVGVIRELLAERGLSGIAVVAAQAPAGLAQCLAAGLAVRSAQNPVLVHDMSWPVFDPESVGRVVAALRAGAAAVIPARPVTDSIKAVDELGFVAATVDRSELTVLQYPHGYRADVLSRLVSAADVQPFDDFRAAQSAGVPIELIAGDSQALDVELPRDADFLAAVIDARQPGR